MTRLAFGILITGLLAGCAGGGAGNGDYYDELPEGLAQMAGPNQDLSKVTLLEEDNCFWYEHVGPVETTLLPLRSVRGRHLCAAPAGQES